MSYTEDRLRNLRGVSPARGQPVTQQYSQAYPQTSSVSTPVYQPAPQTYVASPQPYISAPSSSNQYMLHDAHSKVHEKIDQRLRLETEKRELELLIEGEVQRQKQMNSRYEEQKKKLRDEIYNLETRFQELEGKYESKNKVCKEIDDKITETKAESRKLEQENKTIMSELKRLAEKTNQQIIEQQTKLKQNIAALEAEKDKFRKDTEQKKMENANLIKKSEEDYIKKLGEISNRVATAQAERERYHKDVGFLKDKLASLEKEAEVKLKEMETKIRDDEKNKRSAAMMALNQKLKSAEEKRANQEKITSQLERELKDLEIRANEILGPLDKEAKSIKDSIDDCKKGIEVSIEDIATLRKQISDADKECAMLTEARQRLRQEMARAEEQHASAVREQNEKFNAAKRNYENEIAKLRRNIEDKERELKRHEDEYNGLNREHQRLMTNLQNNITKTFSNTVNDVKPTIAALDCDKHPAYKVTHFCARRQCGFGLLCEACQDLDHGILGHHRLDGIALDNMQDLKTFAPLLLGDGLHYEENEQLRRNVSRAEAGRLAEKLKQLEVEREAKASDIDGRVEALLKELVARLELRMKRLKKDLIEDMKAFYGREIETLRYLSNACDRLLAKQEAAQTRFARRFDKLAKAKSWTVAACTYEMQLMLEAAFTEAEIKQLKDVRAGLSYLDEAPAIEVDTDSLGVSLNLRVLNELEHMFSGFASITRLEDCLHRRLSLEPADDMVGSVDAIVDERVKLVGDRKASAVLSHGGLVMVAFVDGIIRVYSVEGLRLNEHLYESSYTMHSTSVSLLVMHSHQNRLVLCSSDIGYNLAFSHLDEDGLGLQLHYRVTQAHAGKIVRLISLSRSAFVVSFGEEDRVKIWNATEKYLALIVDQYNSNRILDVCAFNDDRFLCIGYGNMLNIHRLEYTTTSRAIRSSLISSIKTASTHLSLLSLKLYVYLLRSDDSTNHLMSFHETDLEVQSVATCPLDKSMRIASVGGKVFAYTPDSIARTVRFLDTSMKPVHTVEGAVLFDSIPLHPTASKWLPFVAADLQTVITSTLS